MRKLMMAAALALPMFGSAAMAQDTLKIGYIDPLSGGGASVGEVGLKTFQFLADELNAKGGILGKKVEIVPLDNKTNPQESLVQAQKAIDAGIRYHHPGQRLVGGRRARRISSPRYNERNPGKEVLYFNYAAVDPVLTNDKCSFWHFRWDANSDIKMEALTNYMKGEPAIKKVYLINQDYSFGQAVRTEARNDAGGQAPRHRDRRRRTASAAQGHRLLALHRQDQGVRRRHRHHRQLGPGLRAAAEGGRRRRPARSTGTPIMPAAPAARPRSSRPASIIRCSRSPKASRTSGNQPAHGLREGVPRQVRLSALFYPRAVNEMRMFKAAAEKAKSIDPVKVAAALEGMKFEVFDGGEGFMRKDDHQFFQPIYISSFGER